VRAFSLLSKERLPSLPDVPTAKEAGIDNWKITAWYGMLAPAVIPRNIINRLNVEWFEIAAMHDTREQIYSFPQCVRRVLPGLDDLQIVQAQQDLLFPCFPL